MIGVNGSSRSVIILPENSCNKEFVGACNKIEGIINGPNTQLVLNANESIHSNTQKRKRTIKKQYTETYGPKSNKRHSRKLTLLMPANPKAEMNS